MRARMIRGVGLLAMAAWLLPAQPVRPRILGQPVPGAKRLPRQLAKKAPHPLLERIDQMSPAEREQFFNRIPRDKRDQVRRRWETWNKMAPDERERLGLLVHELPNLPPQRLEAARLLFRRFSSLPADRQAALRDEVDAARRLSPEERRARINSDEFRNQFSDEEKRLMLEMGRIFPSGAPPQPLERQSQ